MDYGRYSSGTSPGRINQKLRSERHDFTIAFLCATSHSITLTALCSSPLCHCAHHATLCLCLSQQFITIALQYHALPLRFIPQLYFPRLPNAIARRCRSMQIRGSTPLSSTSPLPCLATQHHHVTVRCIAIAFPRTPPPLQRIAAPR